MVEELLVQRIKEIKSKVLPKYESIPHSPRAKMAQHLLELNETMLEILRNRRNKYLYGLK